MQEALQHCLSKRCSTMTICHALPAQVTESMFVLEAGNASCTIWPEDLPTPERIQLHSNERWAFRPNTVSVTGHIWTMSGLRPANSSSHACVQRQARCVLYASALSLYSVHGNLRCALLRDVAFHSRA